MSAGQIILRDVIVKHDIPVKTHYGTTHVVIFYDPKTNTTWAWKTSTLPTFKEHCSYSIIATDAGDYNISHVRELGIQHHDGEISEQEATTKKNALDILFPDINLTNDEKYDMITTKKGGNHNGLI